MSVLGPKCCLTPDKQWQHNANYYLVRKVILDFYSQFFFQGVCLVRIPYEHFKSIKNMFKKGLCTFTVYSQCV